MMSRVGIFLLRVAVDSLVLVVDSVPFPLPPLAVSPYSPIIYSIGTECKPCDLDV